MGVIFKNLVVSKYFYKHSNLSDEITSKNIVAERQVRWSLRHRELKTAF